MLSFIRKHSVKILIILSAMLALLILFGIFQRHKEHEQYVPYTKFLEQLDSGEVESVHIILGGAKFDYTLEGEEKHNSDNPRTSDFKEKLLLAGVEKVTEGENTSWHDFASGFLSIAMILAMLFIVRNMTDGMRDVDLESTVPELGFDDIAGMAEIKEEFVDLSKLIKKRKESPISARMPRGILLQGPPGTGKTYLAKAFAGEVKYSFYAVNASQFGNVFAGLGAKQINNLFKMAKENAPSIIFIDEFDSLGFSRTGSSGSVERDNTKTLTALLANMDGFNNDDEVLVIAATNRAEDLDPALLRPGRFDKKLVINVPDKDDRREVLEYHLRGKALESDSIKDWLLTETTGYTPAEIESLVNEASINAIRKDSDVITKQMFEDAIVLSDVKGKEKKNRHRSAAANKLIAYHESGHALISALVCKENIRKVTILATTSGAGGYTKSSSQTEDDLRSVSQVKGDIMKLYAGFCSERILCGDFENISIGASSDMQRATNLIVQYMPFLSVRDTNSLIDYTQFIGRDNDELMRKSEQISAEIIRKTETVLRENWQYVENMASLLLEKETLREDDIAKVFTFLTTDDNR